MPLAPDIQQDIGFVQSAPGVRIAYGVIGTGPALLRVLNWASHLQFNLHLPLGPLHGEFGKLGCYAQYDPRGSGLSTRDIAAGSLSDWVTDLSAVIDAAGLARTGLLAYGSGGAASVRYAMLHPDRVSHLILIGALVRSPSAWGVPIEFSQALSKLMRDGWDHENPAYRHMMARRLFPEASDEEIAALNHVNRVSYSGEFVASVLQAALYIDVSEDLPKIKCPTLIIHSLRDSYVPFEEACRTASLIPGAKLEPIDSASSIAWPSHPEYPKMRQLILDFVRKHG